LQSNNFERIPVSPVGETHASTFDPMFEFKASTGNNDFKITFFTWVSLFILLVLYPILSLMGDAESFAEIMKDMTPDFLVFLLIFTILFQWGIFLVNYISAYTENTGLAGLGLKRIRLIDFAWAAAFLAAANLILAGLSWLLAQFGMVMSGDLEMLIPKDTTGRIIWILVSFTAGFCEEIGFRGYIMTRLRLIGKFNSWLIPVIISSLAFGICHAYQGWTGLIVISCYGVLFSLLYIRTGSLWPCVIAHFFQDLGALFFPQ